MCASWFIFCIIRTFPQHLEMHEITLVTKFKHKYSGIVAFAETIQWWFSLSLGRCYPQQPVCIRSKSYNATHFCIRLWLYTFPLFFFILAILYFNFEFRSLIKNSVLGCAIKFWCRYTIRWCWMMLFCCVRATNWTKETKRNNRKWRGKQTLETLKRWKEFICFHFGFCDQRLHKQIVITVELQQFSVEYIS